MIVMLISVIFGIFRQASISQYVFVYFGRLLLPGMRLLLGTILLLDRLLLFSRVTLFIGL